MRRTLGVMALSLLLVGVVASPVAATRDGCVSIETREYSGPVADPGTVFMRDSSVAIRGAAYQSTVVGHPYLDGDNDIVFNLNLDLITLSGTGWGTFDLASAHVDGSGFQGVYRVAISDFDLDTGEGTYTGRAKGWGYGEFDGLVFALRGSYAIGDEYQASEGFLCHN